LQNKLAIEICLWHSLVMAAHTAHLKPRRKEMSEAKEKAAEVVTSYKGFDQDLKCRGFQFKMGETVQHEGEVKACGGGFHACEYPLDVFGYYPPNTSRFAIVEQSGDLSRESGGDTKLASRKLTVKAEIGIPGIIKAAIEYTFKRALPIDKASPAYSDGYRGAASATGYSGAASATGYSGAASATGYRGAASATGTRGAASATGYSGAASATGYSGAASATGYSGAASATGTRGAASATGESGAASATGESGAASATGESGAASATGESGAASATGTRGAASATGTRGAASATGYRGAASATGTRGAASATGYRGAASATGTRGAASATGESGAASATGESGAASATGEKSAAMASGRYGKAQGEVGCAIFLVYRDADWNIKHAKAAIVGQDGIAPNVWYSLDENGNFVAADTE
jgi:hypothetical protein